MTSALLIQLPLPRLHVAQRAGNIALAAACLKQAAHGLNGVQIELMPERLANCLGDAALLDWIEARHPEVIGFTVYAWNLQRTLYLAQCLKNLYGPRIICGGPEITPDNPLLDSPDVDTWVFGEGESVFRRLLRHPQDRRRRQSAASSRFHETDSPYLDGLLDPQVENMVLLETQRGCPYRCAYCYYGKARRQCAIVPCAQVLKAIEWTHARGINELYLLDPSFNARPDLMELLDGICTINHDHRLRLISELRAEAVDQVLADRFSQAGFQWFEVGLQTTNPRALKLMNRTTDLDAFIRGTTLLRQAGIATRVDLIIGLPGDTSAEFEDSVNFAADYGLAEDIQIFPLLVLPGTAFRSRAAALGLEYELSPPYSIVSTPTFNADEIWSAIAYAEEKLDLALFPLPKPSFAWRDTPPAAANESIKDQLTITRNMPYLGQLRLDRVRPLSEIEQTARRLSSPYQLLITDPGLPLAYLSQVLTVLTRANPCSALEMVFLEPRQLPNPAQLLSAAALLRPHYLDQQLRFCYPAPGNRAVLFTLVSADSRPRFQGTMQRQVFWWRQPHPPAVDILSRLIHFDGVLIDALDLSTEQMANWIAQTAPLAQELPHLCFIERRLEYLWIRQTQSDDYDLGLLAPEPPAS